MRAGQKSITNGIENALCPFTDIFITQASGGEYSHKGTKAVDIRGIEPGIKYPYYAPFTCKCVGIVGSSGQSHWQSLNEVNTPIGKQFISFVITHDDTQNVTIGLIVPQGNQIGNMGTKGNATGVHCHIEFAKGKLDLSNWKQNQFNNWCYSDEIEIEEACFMNDTNIILGFADWKYLPEEEPIIPDLKDYEKLYNEELKKNSELVAKNDSLMAKNEELNMELSKYTFITKILKNDMYAIKLFEDEELYIKNMKKD